MKATGINIEWGSPAGYCARGINRCFGGQIFARASTCTAWSCWGRRGVWCHVFWGYRLLKHTLIGMNSKPLKSCGMRSKLVSSERRQWYLSDPIAAAPQWPPTGPPGVWGFHLSGVGRAYSNRSLPVNIPRCSVTPLTSVLSIQGSFSYCIHFTPWQCCCNRNFHLTCSLPTLRSSENKCFTKCHCLEQFTGKCFQHFTKPFSLATISLKWWKEKKESYL